MRSGLITGRENAGALHCDINGKSFVWQLSRVLDGGDFDRAAANVDGVTHNFHVMGKAAMHAVEAQQVSICLNGPKIVDRNDFDVFAATLHDRAQHVAANAAKTVDRDFHRHRILQKFDC